MQGVSSLVGIYRFGIGGRNRIRPSLPRDVICRGMEIAIFFVHRTETSAGSHRRTGYETRIPVIPIPPAPGDAVLPLILSTVMQKDNPSGRLFWVFSRLPGSINTYK